MGASMKWRQIAAVLAGVLVGLLWSLPAAAQATPQPSVEETPAPGATPEDQVDVSKIEQILRGEERVFKGEKFSYDPAGRRDPFRSLLEGMQEEERPGQRPPGLAGMMIEELKVEGIVQTSGGILAFAQGRDNLSYILRPGTELFNGTVKEIYPDKVIFRQQVNDPKALKPYREVVREISGD